ncbi:hypothetical protein CW702_00565 [Candidatus Bathyarchaeota archaeon]|nr:MAG: hypothetical protein CW702_00565 [Candidatus Bathyarchaeota archaeon]
MVVEIFVGDERKGVAVIKNHDNRSYIFALSKPVMFKDAKTAGSENLITLVTPDSEGGTYRIEKIILLKKRLPRVSKRFLFKNVKAVPLISGSRVNVRITWITNWPTRSIVEFGTSKSYGKTVVENDVVNNHVIIIRGLKPGETYHFRLIGETPHGLVRSKDYTFHAQSPPKPKIGKGEGEVKLTVRGFSSIPEGNWPVTSGIPFPRGTLASERDVALYNSSGVNIPLQTSVLARWPDRSVKWLLLDFQADIKSDTPSEYTLRFGKPRRAGLPLKKIEVISVGHDVIIDTGPLRVLLDPNNIFFPGRIWLDGVEITDPQNPGVIKVIDEEGTVYSSNRGKCKITIEEDGPLRATVKISGTHQSNEGKSLLAYTVRLNAYAGKSYLRIFHTWENNEVDRKFTRFRGLYIDVPTRLKRTLCTLLLSKGEIYKSENEVSLFQRLDDDFIVTKDGRIVTRGDKAAGLIDLSDGEKGVTVTVRNFWQNYPKSLEANGKTVRIGICPILPTDYYPPEEKLEDKLFLLLAGRSVQN